jgi:hypothetical protein
MKSARLTFTVSLLNIASALISPVYADEAGVSFWLPGQYGSLAAVPQSPGLNVAILPYHSSVEAGGDQVFDSGVGLQAGLEADVNLGFLSTTYVFEQPVLGGQFAFGLAQGVGNVAASIEATVTGPGGGIVSGEADDSRTGFTDFFPTASLRWSEGVNNGMVYLSGAIPIGSYDSDRLANIGIGHGAIDIGGAYTYFNPQNGREFSVTAGLTYNLENPHTDYKNGIDGHIDWAASQFLSETTHVGLAGYYFQQLTGDSGDGATLGDFKSRVVGIGPQVGHIFAMGDMQGYVNLRGYYEFAAKNRPEGWNAFLTIAFSPKYEPATGK